MNVERANATDDPLLRKYDLVVTVGLAAARAVIARTGTLPTQPPTLCLLIPRQAFERLAPRGDGRPRRISAVYLDQPLSRQLDLLRIALPGRNRIGVVLGPTSAGVANDLREGARERDLTINTAEIAESSGVYAALQRVLPASDALLALPDPVAFNATTVYGMMLTTYRAQVPVIGFSEGLVKAGALLGLYSTANQVGRQGAEVAGRVWPAMRQCRRPSIRAITPSARITLLRVLWAYRSRTTPHLPQRWPAATCGGMQRVHIPSIP